jgi:hypothetical protein
VETPITLSLLLSLRYREVPMDLLLNFVYTVASVLFTALFVNGS